MSTNNPINTPLNPDINSTLNTQYGGNHYKDLSIQPIEIAHKNNLCFRVFSAIKYMFRHNKTGGEKDLDIKKAIHYLQILLEQEYNTISLISYRNLDKHVNTDDHDDEHIHRNRPR